VNFAGCWADCAADDDVCIGNCAEQWPQGGLDFYDFLYCTYQECFDVCS
jgi:hypothetical protein